MPLNPALLPLAAICTALFAWFSLAPLIPARIGWGEALGLLPGQLLEGAASDLLANFLLGLPLGLFWSGVFWRPRPSWAAQAGILMGLLLLAAAVQLGQVYWPPRLVAPGGFIGQVLGFALGMALWWLAAPFVLKRVQPLHPSLWRGAVLVAAMLPFLPLDPTVPLTDPALPPEWLSAQPQRLYLLIKGAMLWVPVGLLFALAGRGEAVPHWGLALPVALLLEGWPHLGSLSLREVLELLFALPGLWAGVWLGEQTRLPEGQPARVPSEASPLREDRRSGFSRESVTDPIAAEAAPTAISPLGFVLGLVLLSAALAALIGFPRWPWLLGLGLTAYAGFLWAWPTAWLVAVPAALPLLDLAPWTGRFFLDEFDLLMLVTAGVLFMRPRAATAMRLATLAGPPLIAMFALSVLASAALHLLPLSALGANTFSSYWSPYNGLRVLKGFVWGGLLFLLLRRGRIDSESTLRLMALGMALGLLGVGLVGVWERWLYAGLDDGGRAYRIVATFSSMHTGGGHIEAWLAAALPFLWLGMFRLRHLALAGLLAILAAYVAVYTVSRGGVLALGVEVLLLALASLRHAWGSGLRRLAVPALMLVGVGGVLALGLSGGHFQQRLSTVGQDWQTRVEHWQRALDMMDDGLVTGVFGMGPGSFPRVWLARGPLDNQPATYGFSTDMGNTWLRLGVGETLYYAQRVPAEAGRDYRLSLKVRSDAEKARIDTPLCEKQMLNSRRCVWFGFDVPGDGQWHGITHNFSSGEVGGTGVFDHLPTEFVLRHAGRGGVIEVDDVQLLDETGRNLLCNGDFSRGADCWFFKTHSHLPWHIKNLWVHLYFELGALGLVLFAGLTLLAMSRLAGAAWRGEKAAWVLLASLAGLWTVGMFDSLLDAPRLAMLLVAFTLLGAGTPWGRGKTSMQVPWQLDL